MLYCLAVRLQVFAIGVTTKDPDSEPVPQEWSDIDNDQFWYCMFGIGACAAWHNAQERLLYWDLDRSVGSTFGCHVSGTGELHLHHSGRDVGVAFKGLPTDQPFWGFVDVCDLMMEADYIISNCEAVWCNIVCGVIFVSLNIGTC